MTNWTELIVTDADGTNNGPLGGMVETDPDMLRNAVLDNAGSIREWEGFSLSAEGEEPDWDTPRAEVNWDGLREKLGR